MPIYEDYILNVGRQLAAKKNAQNTRIIELRNAAAQVLERTRAYAQIPAGDDEVLVLTSADQLNGNAVSAGALSTFSDDFRSLKFGIGFSAKSGQISLGTVGISVEVASTNRSDSFRVIVDGVKHDFVPHNPAPGVVGGAVWEAVTRAFEKSIGL
ncbi:hypothetical protein [Burkholderia cepacia]|uniref:Uncharacterized protein n=1 Tax=Burkholderia cepacia TaxID=292 RepID=A0AAE8T2C6_BURCE|nr:hypothetical protein [Burkholderia cepacia]SPV16678.1 Uncharacterised protein [Burkholderia cepacia]